MIIRRELESDFRNVEELTREAFWNLYFPGCDEHYLVHILRTHQDFIKELDFVAEVDNQVVGNIMYTRSFVKEASGELINTATFGPVCVHPSYQRRGIGSALINHTKGIAREMGFKAIIILGHPDNYCKHGFKNTVDFSITNFQGKYPAGQLVLELEKDVFKGKSGTFIYSDAFNLDPEKVSEFDKSFPSKEKHWQPSQEVFSIAVRSYMEKPE
jgi:predicted N-acetyltransferase YhbS